MKPIVLYCLSALSLIACRSDFKKTNETDLHNTQEVVKASKVSTDIYGNYVDNSYKLRNKGYDWLSVSVKKGPDQTLLISVRSRADKKKPTCTFDSRAYKKDDKTYESFYNGKKIIYNFSKNSINISTKYKADENVLAFFCSGGASIAGTYAKIFEPLDPEQLDKTSFSKVLTLQGVGFNIASIEKNGTNTLSIFTTGLQEKEFRETFDIDGTQVMDAEVEDLNSDGSPELLIYTQSDGSGSYGKVIAFSVNRLKSMSQVYFPPVADNEKINKGYMGHDEFSLVETSLVQRFPIYKDGDPNSNPSGGIRQVSYKLADGEAGSMFVVDKISNN